MGEAPDSQILRFIRLIETISKQSIQSINLPLIYVGDTVADVMTIKMQKLFPNNKFLSFAIAPPHLHKKKNSNKENHMKNTLLAGADHIFKDTYSLIKFLSL